MKRVASLAKKALASVVFMALITLGLPQLAAPVMAAEDADDPCMVSGSQKFVVTFTNISEGSDTPTPFAPGVYVVHADPNVLFESGQPNLGNGLEALAEDGNPGALLESIVSMMAHDMDGMEEPHMDMAMMMGMSMEEMAAMAMMSMDVAMTMSEEDLNSNPLPQFLHLPGKLRGTTIFDGPEQGAFKGILKCVYPRKKQCLCVQQRNKLGEIQVPPQYFLRRWRIKCRVFLIHPMLIRECKGR